MSDAATAGGSLADQLRVVAASREFRTLLTVFVVVGGGLAGLSAAIDLMDAGAEVIVSEHDRGNTFAAVRRHADQVALGVLHDRHGRVEIGVGASCVFTNAALRRR